MLTSLALGVASPAVDPWVWRPRPDVWLLVIALYGGYHYVLAARGPTAVDG